MKTLNYKTKPLSFEAPKNITFENPFYDFLYSEVYNRITNNSEYEPIWDVDDIYNDIYDVAIQNNFNVVIKRKNQLNQLEIKRNKYFFDNFFLKPNVISIDSNISAFRLVEKSYINISLPFTSTGLIGSVYGKKSIYYDPFKWIQKNDPSGSNLPLLSGKDELEEWFHNLKK